jgi:hypothetical protein
VVSIQLAGFATTEDLNAAIKIEYNDHLALFFKHFHSNPVLNLPNTKLLLAWPKSYAAGVLPLLRI